MRTERSEVLAERRAAVLSQLVLLFAEGRDPVDLADDAVQLVARATDAAAVFVYLWDEDEERLVLRVGTPGPQEVGIGGIRLRLGEGIAGWSALRRQSVIIDRLPQTDPRHVRFEEIDESEFQSVLAAPIADDHDQLRGVFALYSEHEAAFGEDELAIAVEVGRLLASGLVRAETVEDLDRQSATARFLLDFPTSSRTSLIPTLQFAARRVLDLLDADACTIEYSSRRDADAAPVILATRVPTGEHRIFSTHSRAAARSSIERHGAGSESVSVALGMGASRGVLACYRHRRFRSQDLDRLSTLAAQLGVQLEAVDLAAVTSSLATRLLFCEDADQAHRILQDLGVDGPVCPAVFRVRAARTDWSRASRGMKDALASAAGPKGVVLLDSNWAIVLMDAPGGRFAAEQGQQLLHAAQRSADELGLRIAGGVGPVMSEAEQLRSAMNGAMEALEWSEFVERPRQVAVTSYTEVRDVLALGSVMSDLAPTVVSLTRQIEPLVRYDLEQGSQLVRTFSALATCGGSVNDTAAELVIHRNTLRQRMQRIEQILGFSLTGSTDWVSYALAARVADLRVTGSRPRARTK